MSAHVFIVTNRFASDAPALVFQSLDDRALKGTWGFLGSGVPMLPEERREFERMLAEGVNHHIGTSKVLNIVRKA
jgi:hypothetical protein